MTFTYLLYKPHCRHWRIYILLPIYFILFILEIFAKASKIFCRWFNLFVCCVNVWVSASIYSLPHVYCQFMCSCLTNHADIKNNSEETAADEARKYGHYALANYVEVFQPGPRGELAISCCCTQ